MCALLLSLIGYKFSFSLNDNLIVYINKAIRTVVNSLEKLFNTNFTYNYESIFRDE